MDVSTSGSRTVLQFCALALIWGASFLFIKVAVAGISPVQVTLGRLLFGAMALLVVMAATSSALPRGIASWAHLGVLSIVLCVIPFTAFAWAEQYVSSGLASMYNATAPLMTMLVALLALPAERPTPPRLGGLGLGFGGVLLLLGPWRGLGSGELHAQGACLLATLSYGVAYVYLRRFVSPLGLPAITVATVQVGCGAAIMLPVTPWVATQPMTLTPSVVLAVAALGVLGTGLAYVLNTNVVAAWGATNASTVTYLTPVVGVALGIVVLGERISWNEPLGALLVVAGVVVGQGRPRQSVRFRHREQQRRVATGVRYPPREQPAPNS